MINNIVKRIITATLMITVLSTTVGCGISNPISDISSIFAEDEVYEADKNKTNSYMYNTLNIEQQQLYDKLLCSFEKFITEIDTKVDNTDIETVYEAIMADRPEMFYVSGYVYDNTVIYPNYMYTQDEVADYMNQINSITNTWLQDLDITNTSEYEISKYCFEQVVNNIVYTKESETNQDLYDAVILGEGVSSSYTATYVYLMQKCGITAFAAKGMLSDEEHTWAVTNIDGELYATDTMNGDYSYLDTDENEVFMIDYCCLNMIPACTKNYIPYDLFQDIEYKATAANYYVQNDLLLDGYDEPKIAEIVISELEAGNNIIKLAFSSQNAMETALNQLQGQQRLALFYDGTQAGFLNSERFYSITIIL